MTTATAWIELIVLICIGYFVVKVISDIIDILKNKK